MKSAALGRDILHKPAFSPQVRNEKLQFSESPSLVRMVAVAASPIV